jgi:uncharacterized membrane protein (UPF0127 family)
MIFLVINVKINVKQLDIKIIECKGMFNRAKGFMFKKRKINYGLLFKKCNAIHTFFMYQPIDVVMTDKENNILYLYENLLSNKIIWPKKNVYNTYELPIGTIKQIIEVHDGK